MYIVSEKITMDELVQRLQNGLFTVPTDESVEEEIKKKEQTIMSKLDSGKPLTKEEMAFLKRQNKALYIVAVRIEIKREHLQKRLENAKSKEEVEDIALMSMASIDKDTLGAKYIIKAIDETLKELKKTPYYKSLPANEKDEKKHIVYEFTFAKNAYQMAYEDC